MKNSVKEYIKEIDLSSTEAYKQLLEIFTEKYPMPVLTVPIKAKTVMCRSMQNLSESNFIDFKDLSYPPKEVIKGYSRVNRPFEQIFYASDSHETNLIELLPYWSSLVNEGDTIAVTIGFWQLDVDILVGIIPDLENKSLMDFIKESQFSKDFIRNIDDWKEINRYFKAQGFYDNNIYKFSSAFCKAVIENIKLLGDSAQGVLYTSVQNKVGWNIALNPNFVDKHLHLVRVGKQLIRRNRDENGRPSYDNFQTPIIARVLDKKNRKIIW